MTDEVAPTKTPPPGARIAQIFDVALEGDTQFASLTLGDDTMLIGAAFVVVPNALMPNQPKSVVRLVFEGRWDSPRRTREFLIALAGRHAVDPRAELVPIVIWTIDAQLFTPWSGPPLLIYEIVAAGSDETAHALETDAPVDVVSAIAAVRAREGGAR